ncbi:MAG: acyl-CoA thioesterase [Bacteroidetes bacterium]|nr:acyl-CoA thioesterase [Bacteroidota bacterium]
MFESQLRLRIDWSEQDLYGHINNVSYFKYIQASRVNLWEQTGLSNLLETDNIGPMLASTSCQFRKALFYPGEVIIEAKVKSIGNTSFIIDHLLKNSKGEIAAEAQDVIVMYDFTSEQKISIPVELKAILSS